MEGYEKRGVNGIKVEGKGKIARKDSLKKGSEWAGKGRIGYPGRIERTGGSKWDGSGWQGRVGKGRIGDGSEKRG